MYTSTVVDDEAHAMKVMKGMEEAWEKKDESYIIRVLKTEPSLVLRYHAVCILAEVGGEKSVPALTDVLLHDPDPLVRHESAAALGSVGSPDSEGVLLKAASDADEMVRNSAKASLFNIRFLKQYSAGTTARERAPRP